MILRSMQVCRVNKAIPRKWLLMLLNHHSAIVITGQTFPATCRTGLVIVCCWSVHLFVYSFRLDLHIGQKSIKTQTFYTINDDVNLMTCPPFSWIWSQMVRWHIKHTSIILTSCSLKGFRGAEAYPSCLWVVGRLLFGQVTSLSQS